MEYLQIISVPVIAVIVYWVVNLIKYATTNNEKFKRFIPLVSAGLGALLGILCYFIVPEILVGGNVLVALISGGASGLSATGCNQIIKQLSSKNEEDKTDE